MLLMAFLLAATMAIRTDEAALEERTRSLIAARADGDVARALSFFAADTPERRLVEVRLAGEARAYCFTLHESHIESVSIAGDEATVVATSLFTRTGRGGHVPLAWPERRTFTFQRKDGVWRVVRWRSEEESLADQIAAADRDVAAVQALLDANAHLMGVPFVEEVLSRHATLGLPLVVMPRDATLTVIRRAEEWADARLRAAMTAAWIDWTRTTPAARREEILGALTEASRVAKEAGDLETLGALTRIQAMYLMDDDEGSLEAEALLRWILANQHQLAGTRTVQHAIGDLGAVLFARQDYAGSHAMFQRIVEGNPNNAAFGHFYLGRIYAAQNDPRLALSHFTRAIEKRTTGHVPILSQLGAANAHRELGDIAAAKQQTEAALTAARTAKRPGLIARGLVSLAEIALLENDRTRATSLLREAIDQAREARYPPAQIDALLTLGHVELISSRPADALTSAQEVLKLSDELDRPGFERYNALILAGRAHRAAGDDAAALQSFERAIERLEEVREAVAGAEREQRLFFEPASAAYIEVVDLLLRQNRMADALTYAERAKARVLLDVLRSGGRGGPEDVATREDRIRYEDRVRKLQRLNRRMIATRAASRDAGAIAKLEREVRAAQFALDELDAELAARYPRLRRARGEPFDAATLRRVVSEKDRAFIELVVHEKSTVAFVVRRGTGGEARVSAHRIAIGRKELERRVSAFAAKLESRDIEWNAAARSLYKLLIAPLERDLKDARTIGIAPDAALWRLPFEALVDSGGRFLIERAALFYTPSLAVYDSIRARGATAAAARPFVAFGNPRIAANKASKPSRGELAPLPEAEDEVRAIAALYGARSRVYVGDGATEAVAKDALDEARVVHFATHSLFDDENPMYSQLVLASGNGAREDGALQAWEMMRLDVHADLVVLSACDTARGRVGAGEGLIGMSWALFVAGSPSMVATLWKIGSDSAAELMVEFHRELLRSRGTDRKAEALRAAQLQFIRNARTRHPYYWSAFVLVGDPS